jgi:hypothetical protein
MGCGGREPVNNTDSLEYHPTSHRLDATCHVPGYDILTLSVGIHAMCAP